jgi:prephenate dehydratase
MLSPIAFLTQPALPGARPPANTRARFLQAGIEDDKRNFTRFFLIRKSVARALRTRQKGRAVPPAATSA